MRPRVGRNWGKATAAALACVAVAALGACGSEEEPAGATPGSVEPIGELAGPSVPLESAGGFDNLLALTVESSGQASTLLVGQVVVGRPGADSTAADAEIRIAVDGKEERDAEARTVTGAGGAETVVIACACELGPGEHEIELQGRSSAGSTPISARALVGLDGVAYDTEPSDSGGPLPPAINGASLETDSVLVTGSPSSLGEVRLASGTTDSDELLILGQIGSTDSAVDASSVNLQAGSGGQEAERIVSQPSASTIIDVFTLDGGAAPGESIELLGNFIGGGTAALNLRSVITCPCGLGGTAPE